MGRETSVNPLRRWWPLMVAAAGVIGAAGTGLAGLDPPWTSGIAWPRVPVVDPGPPGGPPSDAVVLFDGRDLSRWEGGEKWTIRDGYAEAGGTLTSREPFGDCQLHLEWSTPPEDRGEGQARGNSGVKIMGLYEVQILDSFRNDTYFDGQAAAVYKQRPPLANACRPPGEWQNYDIIFRAPRFDAAGRLISPAFLTVLHNGVLVQDHFELLGATNYRRPPSYAPHPPRLPLVIQYHGSPVRFRNIWIRPLPDPREDLLAELRARLRSGPQSAPAAEGGDR